MENEENVQLRYLQGHNFFSYLLLPSFSSGDLWGAYKAHVIRT